nr:f-box/kelch-repeat protein [Quercus suber]
MESVSWRRERCSNLELADELLEEILSRLPVKSIVRFKCVKKSWYSLFENPSFIAKHHRLRCCSQTNPSLLIESNDSIDDIIVMSLLHPPYNEIRMLDMNIRFNNTNGGFSMRLLRPNMCGCINGIICIGGSFGDSFNGFFLWNPAIRQYKVVPYPTLPPCALALYPDLFYTDVSYAFGYDNNSNDYKVVRIVTYKRYADDTMVENTFVHVYTLSTDSWRQIINPKFDCLNIIYKNNFDEKYLNGFYYWHGAIKDRDYEVIIGFDMSREDGL